MADDKTRSSAPQTPFSRREFLPIGFLFARHSGPQGAFLTYDQARESCQPPLSTKSEWPHWIESHDAAIRARLLRGEEDSLVNFVLFGVSLPVSRARFYRAATVTER